MSAVDFGRRMLIARPVGRIPVRPLVVCPMLTAAALAGAVCRRDDDRLRVGRDCRVATDESVRAGIHLQGGTEHAHGITSTLRSAVAIRAGEIVTSGADRRPSAPAGRTPATIGER